MDVSLLTLQRSQIKGNAKPLHERLSYVGILLCRNLQTKSDMVGGMFLFQGKIDQKAHGLGLFLNYRPASSSEGHYLHSSNQHIIQIIVGNVNARNNFAQVREGKQNASRYIFQELFLRY